jgi:REP element-mobilizing transposase RayT
VVFYFALIYEVATSILRAMKIRKYDYRRDLPHIELAGRAHFVTFTTHLRWELPPLARDLVLNHCLHDNERKLQLYIAVVMPDHVHLIFVPLENESHETFSFEEIVGAIKGASAHSINKALKRSGQVWQDESFDHIIRHAESLEQKIQYVRDNPVRKRLVAKAEDYLWLWEGAER